MGDLAPSFALSRAGGERWSSDSETARGPVLLAILETDCPTCRLVVPYLKRLDETLGSNPGRVIAISQDPEDDTRQMVESLHIELPTLLDRDLEVSRLFELSSVPALILIGTDGRIEFTGMGFHKGDLNEIAARMLVALNLEPQTIAEPNDGAPESKPGCASRHLEPPVDITLDRAAPIDLRPETGARATRIAVDDDTDLYDYCMEAGFSPCLPVVPPTARSGRSPTGSNTAVPRPGGRLDSAVLRSGHRREDRRQRGDGRLPASVHGGTGAASTRRL